MCASGGSDTTDWRRERNCNPTFSGQDPEIREFRLPTRHLDGVHHAQKRADHRASGPRPPGAVHQVDDIVEAAVGVVADAGSRDGEMDPASPGAAHQHDVALLGDAASEWMLMALSRVPEAENGIFIARAPVRYV